MLPEPVTLGMFVGKYLVFEAGLRALALFDEEIRAEFEAGRVKINNQVHFELPTKSGLRFGWKINNQTLKDWPLNWEWALGLQEGWTFYVIDAEGEKIPDTSPLRERARLFGWLELYSDFQKRLPQIKPQLSFSWLEGANLYYKTKPKTVTAHLVQGMYWMREGLVLAESFNTYVNRGGVRFEMPAVVVYNEPVSYADAQMSEESLKWPAQLAFLFNKITLAGFGPIPLLADVLTIESAFWLYRGHRNVQKAIDLVEALAHPSTYRVPDDAATT